MAETHMNTCKTCGKDYDATTRGRRNSTVNCPGCRNKPSGGFGIRPTNKIQSWDDEELMHEVSRVNKVPDSLWRDRRATAYGAEVLGERNRRMQNRKKPQGGEPGLTSL